MRDELKDALDRYILNGILPGGFLEAVIKNDLQDAIGRADEDSMANLPAVVAYLYNEAPAPCWGSPEKMREWLND